ncbi:sensor histidine kinase [Actinomadura oligospora]|uniref:sensor histidine kinase n=1 Tax=Actinomadura oligospora TaxID=111804 RepID=UPI0004BC403D|nr:histidine kinase [Actinomadura oligospora]
MILSTRWTRLATAAVFASAIAFQALAIGVSWGAAYWPFMSVAASAVCVLALLRDRWPVGTASLAIGIAAVAILVSREAHLPAEPSPAMTLGLALMVASAVRTLPVTVAAAVAGGGLAVAVGGEIAARTTSSGSSVANIGALGWLAAVAIGLALRLGAVRARAASERVRREERLALAREMHDVVAHHIASMLIQTQAAQVVARRRPEDMPRTLTDIETTGTDALAAMRRAVALLRDTGDAAPLSSGPESLDDLVHRFGRSGPAVRLHMPDDGDDWPPEVTGTVYRVVQESLTNVARHAPQAGSVTVSVRRDDDRVTVEVVDDAPPPRPHGRAGFGLLGMRERVEALGGTLDAGPGDVGGWAVRAVLPVPREAE